MSPRAAERRVEGRELARIPRGSAALVVALVPHEGSQRADVRVWERRRDGTEIPTPRGFRLRADDLDAMIEALQHARAILGRVAPRPVPVRPPRPQRGTPSHARFATTCPTCGDAIALGAMIRLVGGIPVHDRCSEGP